MKTFENNKKRIKIKINGIVQGVGFRPFVYCLAQELSLTGYVLNSSEGVIIEAEGSLSDLREFIDRIQKFHPKQAKITNLHYDFLPVLGYKEFSIRDSISQANLLYSTLISPDLATCEDCLSELFNPVDRRYKYPFINCTNCGPRFTIIKEIPYDRKNTTMSDFEMCSLCKAEYENPADRRFHAQPNACYACGPLLKLLDNRGISIEIDQLEIVSYVSRLIKEGKIVAIKSLGGYHIVCDATNSEAVITLRRRKYREDKPFALMAKDIETIKEFCEVSSAEEQLLLSIKRPIVLLKKKIPNKIANSVAPNQNYFGVMLPYTPLHYLLLAETQLILVCTSGNISDEPIAYKDEEAISKLAKIADYFLLHNREIHTRCDDSVTRFFTFGGKELIIRRARGYVPHPIELPSSLCDKVNFQILACGAELKNTFCLVKGNYAYVSHHIGDLENLETLSAFEEGIVLFKKLFDIKPDIIAYDLHPEYLSTKYAISLLDKNGLTGVGVQHHHAHIASCMVENKIAETEQIIGVAFDGLGYGLDNNLWGGEFLISTYENFCRVANFRYFPLPGGVKAIKEPWRTAVSLLYQVYGINFLDLNIDFVKELKRNNLCEVDLLIQMINTQTNAPLTSSVGRLFDGVSALLGIRNKINYEGQAAIELEMISASNCEEAYDYTITQDSTSDNANFSQFSTHYLIGYEKIIDGVVNDLLKKIDKSVISAKFHNTLSAIIKDICAKIREKTSVNKVALSGGVFQNMYLLEHSCESLQEENFEIYTHSLVPPNDGGISLGQASIAVAKIKKNKF